MTSGIGVLLDHVRVSVADLMAQASVAERCGAQSLWLTQVPNQRDSGILLAALAASTHNVALGTAVQPLYTAPPVHAAQIALTLDELSHGRLMLGLGVGHRILGEWMLGGTYTPQVAAMQEYVTIVRSLIQDGEVHFDGRWYSGHTAYSQPRRPELPVYLGSSSPRMLELAGEFADGIVLWMCTPSFIRDRVVPAVTAGKARRRDGGNHRFAIAVMLSVALTDKPADGRERARDLFSGYARMENYQRLMAANGFTGGIPALTEDSVIDQLAAIGDESDIAARIADYRAAGATEVIVSPIAIDQHKTDELRAVLKAVVS